MSSSNKREDMRNWLLDNQALIIAFYLNTGDKDQYENGGYAANGKEHVDMGGVKNGGAFTAVPQPGKEDNIGGAKVRAGHGSQLITHKQNHFLCWITRLCFRILKTIYFKTIVLSRNY